MGIGLFGKYPLKRDFVAHNLPRTVLDPIDKWLQSGIATSREARATRWKEMFLVQPIWNFRIGRQITGTDCLGSVMPSVDGVGRYFPLALISYAPPGKGFPIWNRLEIDGWFGQIHERLLSALADGELPTPDSLVAKLDLPPTVDIEERRPGSIVCLPIGEKIDAIKHEIERLDLDLAAAMQSVWWTAGSTHVRRQMILCQGMPAPDVYTHMMGNAPEPTTGSMETDINRAGIGGGQR